MPITIRISLICIITCCTSVTSLYAKYLVNTQSCAIPDLPLELEEFENSTNEADFVPIQCNNATPLLSYVVKTNGNAVLKLRNQIIAEIYGSEDALNCCFSYVWRNTTYPDWGVAWSSCYVLDKDVNLAENLVWVRCYNKTFPWEQVYENIHQVVKLTENLTRKATNLIKRTSNKKPISVLFLVIDGISRLNFIRTMPNTKGFITENGFYEMKAYNKINDNTFPNFMAWLTGLNQTDAFQICKPTENDGLNNCPMIWYTYRDLGYITAYAEDWSKLATFNYMKKGFDKPPTDYYFKPYMDATDYLMTKFQDTMPFCTGPESAGERVLNLARDFSVTVKGLPSFGVFWMNTFSHNNMNTTRRMDGTLLEFFKTLKRDGVLDESVVILLSDHGNRYGDLIATPRGFFEERLPMNYISLPPWFKRSYPQETANFDRNSKNLISTYDLYVTLENLLTLSGIEYEVKASRACPSCKSLFDSLPDDRSCIHAGIPEEWCTCLGWLRSKNFTENINRETDKFVRDVIQSEHETADLWRSWSLKEIESFAESEPRRNPFRNNTTVSYGLIKLQTDAENTYQVLYTKDSDERLGKIVYVRRKY